MFSLVSLDSKHVAPLAIIAAAIGLLYLIYKKVSTSAADANAAQAAANNPYMQALQTAEIMSALGATSNPSTGQVTYSAPASSTGTSSGTTGTGTGGTATGAPTQPAPTTSGSSTGNTVVGSV
jgi:hypothetical protein